MPQARTVLARVQDGLEHAPADLRELAHQRRARVRAGALRRDAAAAQSRMRVVTFIPPRRRCVTLARKYAERPPAGPALLPARPVRHAHRVSDAEQSLLSGFHGMLVTQCIACLDARYAEEQPLYLDCAGVAAAGAAAAPAARADVERSCRRARSDAAGVAAAGVARPGSVVAGCAAVAAPPHRVVDST
jgi:hypothetical protein